MWQLRLQIFLFVYILNIELSEAIINKGFNRPNMHKGNSKYNYLSQQNPLWVLEDQVSSPHQDIERITFTTTRRPAHHPAYFLKYRETKMLPPIGFYRKQHRIPTSIILPKHYIYPGFSNYSGYKNGIVENQPDTWRRRQQVPMSFSTKSYIPSMPVFDSMPNDIDALDNVFAPIFVYHGPKGEMILNTMLSARKYAMQEPIPGEILYPPTVPIFRPKPIVERFRVPGHAEPLNLTLIPFYAHEAIVPHYFRNSGSHSETSIVRVAASETKTAPTTASPPAVLYVAPAPPIATPTKTAATTVSKQTKKRRSKHKKTKQYAVYRSPDEVHWRPTETILTGDDTTTPFPMVLTNPLHNHRYANEEIDEVTTVQSISNFKLTSKDQESQFQIVYMDESLERPVTREVQATKAPTDHGLHLHTPKPLPLLSSHYSTNKEYYAFPVYTLGKLLKPDMTKKRLSHASQLSRNDDNNDILKNNVDTWFILNSRYKGHHGNNGVNRLSSKYVGAKPIAEKSKPHAAEEQQLINEPLFKI